MSRFPSLTVLCRALAVASLAAAAPAVLAAKAPGVSGVVLGVDGKAYAHAKVCVDRSGNARCDAREPAVFSGPDGKFKLAGSGRVVAEVGPGAFLVDAAAHTRVPVTRALVLRAPDSAGAGPRAVGPLSTELQAMADAGAADVPLATLEQRLRARLGLPDDAHGADAGTADFLADLDPATRARLVTEQQSVVDRIAAAVADTGRKDDLAAALAARLDLGRIETVVVIYAENRSFNNLFSNFPGATGVAGAVSAKDAKKRGAPAFALQKDRDGSVLAKLPPVWGGLTAAGQTPAVTQAQTTNVLPNAPFQIDAATPAWGGPAIGNGVVTRDLYHRFFENQMQINGGANDKFAAWGDSGGLVMGWFDGSRTAMWKVAREYTLADRFFQGAFGGSYLNHQYLICACMPVYADADKSPAHPSITILRTTADGKFLPELALADNSPASALTGPPVFKKSGNLTPKDYLGDGTFHSINTRPTTPRACTRRRRSPPRCPRRRWRRSATCSARARSPGPGTRAAGAPRWPTAPRSTTTPPATSRRTTSRSTTTPRWTRRRTPPNARRTSRTMPTWWPTPPRASCRRWPSTSRSARTTSTPATPAWPRATPTSPTSWPSCRRARSGRTCWWW